MPVDGSEKSNRAFTHVLELATNLKADPDIILLYVIEDILLPPLVSSSLERKKKLREDLYQLWQSKAKEVLADRAKEAARAGIKAALMTRYGYPPDEIVKVAGEEKVDLIVLGSTGLRGISRLQALGSVSRSVAERAACPVLIVH